MFTYHQYDNAYANGGVRRGRDRVVVGLTTTYSISWSVICICTDDLIFCEALFPFCFMFDKVSSFVTPYYKLVMCHHISMALVT